MRSAGSADDWIESLVVGATVAVYLKAAGHDRGRATALYEWNASVSAAFHHDLAHVEVGLRNAESVLPAAAGRRQ